MNGVCYWSNHQVPEMTDFNKTLPLVSKGICFKMFLKLISWKMF